MTPTEDLLKPRKHVFRKPKREWGLPSLALGALTAGLLTLVYASFAGWITPDGLAMLAVGLIGALLLPIWAAVRIQASGPRVFAAVNTVATLLVCTVLGGLTDQALERFGQEPFRAVAAAVDEPERVERIQTFGEKMVTLVQRITLGSAPAGASAAQPEAALQAAVHPAAGQADPRVGDRVDGEATVEVPIAPTGRTFTVSAVVDGTEDAEFTFDTGAEVTAVTPAVARALGKEPHPEGERRRFLTAGGPVEDPVITLDSLAVGGAEVRNLEAVVCTRCPTNLLGRNFHEHFRVEIDGRAGVVRLHER